MFTYYFLTNFTPIHYKTTQATKAFAMFKRRVFIAVKDPIKKQFCKMLLIFFCLVKYLYSSYVTQSRTPTLAIFILPVNKKQITMLRAPFRNKIAKKHFFIQRYRILVKINFPMNTKVCFKNFSSIKYLVRFILQSSAWFESNISYLYKYSICVTFVLSKIFYKFK